MGFNSPAIIIPFIVAAFFALAMMIAVWGRIRPSGSLIFVIRNAWLRLFHLAPAAHKVILDNIGEGYLVVNTRNQIVEANRLAGQYFGFAPGDVLGQPVERVLSRWPGLLDILRQDKPVDEHANNQPVEITVGEPPPQYLEAQVLVWYRFGRIKAGQVLILHDITRRRAAEEGLRESERLYSLVINAMPVGIAMTDENGQITFASPKLHELFQEKAGQDVIGMPATRWLHPDERAMGMMRILKVIEDKENLPSQEYRLIRPDGSVFWGEITSTPIIDDKGVSKGLLAIIRDISQRRTLESRLQYNLDQQTFINSLLQILYRPHDLFAALSQVLEQTGIFTRASRVYLCRDSADGAETTIVLEWCCLGISARARETPLFRYKAIPTWKECLEDRGMVLVQDPASAPEDIAEYMTTWNVLSLAAFPIYGSEERLYGFLGFDHCEEKRNWTNEELETLWNACRIVSGAVAQRQVEEAEHRQRILAEVLHDTASALNSTLNFEEVLDRVLVNLEQIVRHDAASIALVDEERIINFVRWRGYDATGDQAMRSMRFSIAERETYRLMDQTGSPIIIADTWLDKRWVDYSAYNWIRSYAGMPIQIKGEIAGFINLDSAQPDFFTPDLIYSLHVFADQAAVAIENARLYDSARRRAEEMSILNRIGLTLTAGLEMNQILVSLYEQCCQVLPVDVFYVALFDEPSGNIEFPLFFEDGQYTEVAPHNVMKDHSLTTMIITQRRTISLPDTLNPEIERKYFIRRLGGQPTRSFVGVPLILLDQVVGVISMQSYQPKAYSNEQVRLLETIATQAAIAVQNARLYDQMKQLAITDSVTLLFTRRHFSALGQSEVERALRYNRKLAVLMVDIDRFKRINDTYGHAAGDQVLLSVANICRQALRITDIIGRWGGEEYVMILPEADKDGAALIAERVRRMVAENEILIPHERTQVAIKVTVSIGVAALNELYSTLDVLIDSADRAMYAAKQGGRNQVCVVGD